MKYKVRNHLERKSEEIEDSIEGIRNHGKIERIVDKIRRSRKWNTFGSFNPQSYIFGYIILNAESDPIVILRSWIEDSIDETRKALNKTKPDIKFWSTK